MGKSYNRSSTRLYIGAATIYLIYKHYTYSNKNSEANIYADDTEIHFSSTSLNSLNSQLQDDLNEISIWMSSNRLSINTSKTVSMIIGPYQKVRNHSLELSLNGAKICNVSSTKYLGLYINCHLNWNDHINYISQRVRTKLAAILRLKPLKQCTVLILLYKAFIVPIFDYCDAVWQPSFIKMDWKLDRLYMQQSCWHDSLFRQCCKASIIPLYLSTISYCSSGL